MQKNWYRLKTQVPPYVLAQLLLFEALPASTEQLLWGRTYAHLAAILNSIQLLKFARQIGVDEEYKDEYGWKWSDWALNNCHQHNFPQIKKNSKPNFQRLAQNLWDAAELGDLEAVKHFLKKTNINCRGKFKRTPLHYAAINGHALIFDFLIQNKAACQAQDQFGLAAIDYISRNPNNRLWKKLRPKPTQIVFKAPGELEVIIIGAGAAGLGSALFLQQKGINYVVLESRNRPGGRIFRKKYDDKYVDLGAHWVHAYNKCNPVRTAVQKFKYPEQQFRRNKRLILDQQQGQNYDHQQLQEGLMLAQRLFQQAESKSKKKDKSVLQAGQAVIKLSESLDPFAKRAFNFGIAMRENYEAADIDQLSGYWMENQEHEAGGDQVLKGGYAGFIQFIAQKVKVQYNTIVQEIDYSGGRVVVKLEKGKQLQADHVIVTIPLGILKTNTALFKPQLPIRHRKAIDALGFGLMNKIVLHFEQDFWGKKTSNLKIISKKRGEFIFFIDQSSQDTFILVGFVTGKFARQLSLKTKQQVQEHVMKVLNSAFKGKTSRLLDSQLFCWDKQQFSCGSYTYFKVGSSPQDCKQLRKNIEKKIWLAGQHCYDGHIGTAHGAWSTGVKAATQIVNLINKN